MKTMQTHEIHKIHIHIIKRKKVGSCYRLRVCSSTAKTVFESNRHREIEWCNLAECCFARRAPLPELFFPASCRAGRG